MLTGCSTHRDSAVFKIALCMHIKPGYLNMITNCLSRYFAHSLDIVNILSLDPYFPSLITGHIQCTVVKIDGPVNGDLQVTKSRSYNRGSVWRFVNAP